MDKCQVVRSLPQPVSLSENTVIVLSPASFVQDAVRKLRQDDLHAVSVYNYCQCYTYMN